MAPNHRPPPTKFGSTIQPKALKREPVHSLHTPSFQIMCQPVTSSSLARNTLQPEVKKPAIHPTPPLHPIRPGIVQAMEKPNLWEKMKDAQADELHLRQAGIYPGDIDNDAKTEKKTRGVRSFELERNEQALRHLSSYFYLLAKTSVAVGEAEVEAMLIKNRVVFSSNNSMTMMNIIKSNKAKKIKELLTVLEPGTDWDDRDNRVISKVGYRSDPNHTNKGEPYQIMQNIYDKAIEDVISSISLKDTTSLKSEKLNGKILFVKGGGFHAEQKLLSLIISNNIDKDEKIIIRGKKRPCLGCYCALRYVSDVLGYSNLNYNKNPGFYWQNSFNSFISEIANNSFNFQKIIEGKILNGEICTYVSQTLGNASQDPGYDTPSDSEDEGKMMSRYRDMKAKNKRTKPKHTEENLIKKVKFD